MTKVDEQIQKRHCISFIRFCASLLISLASAQVFAFGDMRQLPGSEIVAAGEIEQMSCPLGGKDDCRSWPRDLYKVRNENICFTTNVSCGFRCEGFLAERAQVVTLYVASSYSLNSGSIKRVRCP